MPFCWAVIIDSSLSPHPFKPQPLSLRCVSSRRGKHDQKEFKIFLAAVSAEVKAGFKAKLDHESLDWGWCVTLLTIDCVSLDICVDAVTYRLKSLCYRAARPP